jgi:filamentous hemagglutinin
VGDADGICCSKPAWFGLTFAARKDRASINNGKLRALGTSGTTLFNISGLLDNSNGTLESANPDLTLNLGSFNNLNGSLLHVGTGTFAPLTLPMSAAAWSPMAV